MDDVLRQTDGEKCTDISDDIEKDINIEVQITGNTGCTIEHNSQISINYYNLEHQAGDGAGQRAVPGMVTYLTHLPVSYVAALETLRAGKRWSRDELARIAFEALLDRLGIPLPQRRTKRGAVNSESQSPEDNA